MSILLNMKNRVTHLKQLVTRIYQRRERDGGYYAVSYRNSPFLFALRAAQLLILGNSASRQPCFLFLLEEK